MLTCKQKKAFEGYEVKQTGDKDLREKQKPAPPLLHDISAGLARVWRCSSETYTSDNYRAVTVRRFMTHPRIRTHTRSRFKITKKTKLLSVFVSRHWTPTANLLLDDVEEPQQRGLWDTIDPHCSFSHKVGFSL